MKMVISEEIAFCGQYQKFSSCISGCGIFRFFLTQTVKVVLGLGSVRLADWVNKRFCIDNGIGSCYNK